MRADNSFIYIGKIVKAHGTKGEVVIAIEQPGLAEDEQQTLFIRNIVGDYLPYKVDNGEIRQKSSRYSFFVKFDRIDSRTDSEKLVGSEVYKYEEDAAMDEIHDEPELTGCDVFDENGMLFGKVVGEMFTLAHPLIEISHGEGTLLVPYVDEYIADYLPEQNKVIIKNMDRFFE